jgi:hypothetical protein
MNNPKLPSNRIGETVDRISSTKGEPSQETGSPRARERFTDDEIAGFKLGVAKRIGEAFRGLNNTQIARLCRTTDTAIKNYRDGLRFPSPEMQFQMWRMTGVSIHWLMTGEGPMRLEKAEVIYTPEEESRIRELAFERGVSFEEMVKRLATGALNLLDRI